MSRTTGAAVLGAPAPRASQEPRTSLRAFCEPTPWVEGEIGQLTGLRFVAAAWVLIHHVSFVPVDTYAPYLAPLAPIAAAGPLGVDLFFVLSGFVLARAYLDRWAGALRPRQLTAFLGARIARIWPLYAVVTVAFGLWCLARARGGHDDVVSWQAPQPDLGPWGWISQLTMTQLWQGPGVGGISFALPMWSVSAEWLAYLLFPLLALPAWWARRWPRPVLAALAVLWASPATLATVAVALDADLHVWPWFLRVVGGVTAGMLTWLVVRRIRETLTVTRWAHRVILAVVAETLVVVYWAGSAPPTAALGVPARLTLAVPFFPVLLGALVLADPARPGPARWLAGARMRHGGRISYALYLVHFPMLEVLLTAMTRFPALAPHSSGAALLLPHVLVATLLVAHLAHRWIEVPAQRWLVAVRPADAGRSAAGRGAART